jgi:translocation protein SEC72
MSHSHSHAPGEEHSHSHGPPQPQQQILQSPDPSAIALIEQDFKQVDIALEEDNAKAVCGPHRLEKCSDCDVDYVNLNRLSHLFVANPTLLCPPPPHMVSGNMSKVINTTKEEGNVRSR